MKRLLYLSIIPFFLLQAGIVQADKEQAAFAIQKAKAFIAKVKAKGEEMKAPAEGLEKAQDFIRQAQSTLKSNTSILGKLKQEAEPDILYYAEMAEISAATVLSRLEKINQEKENARLEKTLPEVEAKIKIFNDKNAEIQRLTEELKKPKGTAQTYTNEIALLKKEKTEMTDQVSRLKLERENLNGKLEALSGVLASTKKDLGEKTKAFEDLTAENQRLKDDLKALETQKGSDIVETRSKLQSANRTVEFFKALGKLDYLAKGSEKGAAFIVFRKDLMKMTSKGPMLAPGGEALAYKFAELWKAFPEAKLKIDVYGFGNPSKNEDSKATGAMADLLMKTFITKGIKESAIEANGKGSGSPQFSKSAVEENRRVEITVSR